VDVGEGDHVDILRRVAEAGQPRPQHPRPLRPPAGAKAGVDQHNLVPGVDQDGGVGMLHPVVRDGGVGGDGGQFGVALVHHEGRPDRVAQVPPVEDGADPCGPQRKAEGDGPDGGVAGGVGHGVVLVGIGMSVT
jgi:hypothetical protein